MGIASLFLGKYLDSKKTSIELETIKTIKHILDSGIIENERMRGKFVKKIKEDIYKMNYFDKLKLAGKISVISPDFKKNMNIKQKREIFKTNADEFIKKFIEVQNYEDFIDNLINANDKDSINLEIDGIVEKSKTYKRPFSLLSFFG